MEKYEIVERLDEISKTIRQARFTDPNEDKILLTIISLEQIVAFLQEVLIGDDE